jgi:hypothetical protein
MLYLETDEEVHDTREEQREEHLHSHLCHHLSYVVGRYVVGSGCSFSQHN